MTTTNLEDITWQISVLCTDLTHIAFAKDEGRELPRDARDCIEILEKLTTLIADLYQIKSDGSLSQTEDH